MTPIFDKTYKGKKQVKKYIWVIHHKLVLFLQSRNYFRYVPENEIKGGVLGWTTSHANNNIKSMQYQLFSGSFAVNLGRYVVDDDVFHQSGLSTELWRTTDFESNLLVLKLTSRDSVYNIHQHIYSGVSDALACDVGSQMVTILTTRLHLFSVNSALMDLKQRDLFSWATMIWFMSLKVAYITTRKILVCEGEPLAFLLLRGDIVKPRNTTSEPAEREFGNCSMNIWEFTTLEFSHLTQTTECGSRMMSASGFAP